MIKIKNFLKLFFVITLVCSITPAMAIQNEQKTTNSVTDDYTYQQLYKDSRDVLNVFSEVNNTELTPEQSMYLDVHMDRLKIKGETMLYNLQAYLDYLLDEMNRYNSSNDSRKRSVEDMFKEDVNKMKYYLEHGEINDMPININVETSNCEYLVLDKYVNGDSTDPNNKTGPIYNKSQVIVQIKDNLHYIRYMNLENINKTNITLKSGNQVLSVGKDEFNAFNVWNDKNNSNPDHKFNIIVIPQKTPRNIVLGYIWDKQDSELSTKESYVTAGISLLVASFGVGGLALATAGGHRLIDMRRGGQHPEQAQQAQGAVEEGVVEAVGEVVPAPDPDDAAAAQPLLSSGQFVRIYGGVQDRLNQPAPVRIDPRIVITACEVCLGFLIAFGSAVTVFYIAKTSSAYKKEHDNLKKYALT